VTGGRFCLAKKNKKSLKIIWYKEINVIPLYHKQIKQ